VPRLELDGMASSQDGYDTATTITTNDDNETTTPNEYTNNDDYDDDDDDDEKSSPTIRVTGGLDQNSSTMEFRKYLEDLKRNYLEKLTFSCPSKLQPQAAATTSSSMIRPTATTPSATALHPGSRLKSVENNARRSLLYDSDVGQMSIASSEDRMSANKLNKSSKNLTTNSSEFKENNLLNGYALATLNSNAGLVDSVSFFPFEVILLFKFSL
jgi:hypothetical protein